MKKNYYLTLDCETATLPFANEICKTAKEKQNVAIAKPLVYDLGWTITDRKGNIIKTENFLVQEIFFVPNVFNTAYYKAKRSIYMELLKQGKIKVANWNTVIETLIADLDGITISVAYNATFDFKKAIPFTERYIEALYSDNYNRWEENQKNICKSIAKGKNEAENPDFLNPSFTLRENEYPFADLWGIACDRLINIDKYRNYCLDNDLWTASIEYFKTSAETSFQYLMKQYDFVESHTALDDAIIESQILTKALKKGAVKPYCEAFPFRNLGTTVNYVTDSKTRVKNKEEYAKKLAVALYNKLLTMDSDSRYFTRLCNKLEDLVYVGGFLSAD